MQIWKVQKYDPKTQELQVELVTLRTLRPDEMLASTSTLSIWGWDHFKQCALYADDAIPRPEGKFDKNLNHKRKAEFESVLAMNVFQNKNIFLPALNKIRQGMLNYLTNKLHQAEQISETEKNKFIASAGRKFSIFFYSDRPYFGCMADRTVAVSDADAFQMGIEILKSSDRLEHILTAFLAIDWIFDEITPNEDFEIQVSQERHKVMALVMDPILLAQRNRLERDKNTFVEESTQFGITDEDTLLDFTIPVHTRPLNRFIRDPFDINDFVTDAMMREIPYVSGPSGHTAKLLYIALGMTCLSESLSKDELQSFTLTIAAFLIAPGAHSFHEIYSIATLAGVPYVSGRYEDPMPERIKRSVVYQQLLTQYADIIKPIKETEYSQSPQMFFKSKEAENNKAFSLSHSANSVPNADTKTSSTPKAQKYHEEKPDQAYSSIYDFSLN